MAYAYIYIYILAKQGGPCTNDELIVLPARPRDLKRLETVSSVFTFLADAEIEMLRLVFSSFAKTACYSTARFMTVALINNTTQSTNGVSIAK